VANFTKFAEGWHLSNAFFLMCVSDAHEKRGGITLPLSSETWSGRRVSNSRPQPWQGCALPTELLPHFLTEPTPSQRDNGAGDESRTRDLNLGKVALYQLSYSRIRPAKDLNFTQFFGIGKSTLPKKTKNTINTVFEDPFSGVFRRFEAEERL
jgi:hypothetical protein